MRPKSPFVPLCGLLLAVALGATFLSSPGEAAQKPTRSAPVTPAGEKAVAYALERVRRTGSFNHRDYPWVVRARCVRGDTLYFVEFLHRREDGKGFDVVGKAVQAALTFSAECEPRSWPWEVFSSERDDAAPAPMQRDTMRADARRMEIHLEDGGIICLAENTFDLIPPAGLRKGGFRPFAEAAAQLSAEQREALDNEYDLIPEQKLLLAAFGEDCYDLLCADIMSNESGRRVFALKRKGVETDAEGRFKFPTFAVAQFDGTGKVLARFRGDKVTVEKEDLSRLFEGDDSKEVTLRGPDGSKFILPAARADP
jgi:hypothetical protein